MLRGVYLTRVNLLGKGSRCCIPKKSNLLWNTIGLKSPQLSVECRIYSDIFHFDWQSYPWVRSYFIFRPAWRWTLGYDSYLFFVNAESSPGDIPVHFFPGKLRNVLSSEVTQSPRRPPAMLIFNLRSYLFNSWTF